MKGSRPITAIHLRLIVAKSLLALAAVPQQAGAQAVPIQYRKEAYGAELSDLADSQGPAPKRLREVIEAPGTPWMQIYFGEYNLGKASFVTLTSLLDGGQQRHDAGTIAQWFNASAIFNGDAVEVELHVAEGDEGVFVVIGDVVVADSGLAAQKDGEPTREAQFICGDNDNRVLSNDSRVGRLRVAQGAGTFASCTAWLVSNGAVLTAGHCVPDNGSVVGIMEFNVPMSLPDGNPQMALPQDQYPVIAADVAFQSDGPGDDWAVFAVNPNSNTGQRPHLAQGFFRMTKVAPSDGETVRVTGYGLDKDPAGVGGPSAECCDANGDGDCGFECNASSKAQQTATGPYDDFSGGGSIHEFKVDIRPGNSGGPIIWESSGFAIGIVTHAGCHLFFAGHDNEGTAFDDGPLKEALNAFTGANVVHVDSIATHPSETGHVLKPFTTLAQAAASVPSGGIISVVKGDYPASEGNLFTAGADGKAFTIHAPVGLVRIGN